mgnify:CR=1 FL=1
MMKTLVVRPGALGDTILILPFLNTIASQDPEGSLWFLGTRAYLTLLPPNVEARPVDDVSSLWLFEKSVCNIEHPDFVFDTAYLILNSPSVVERNLIRTGTRNVKLVSPHGNNDQHIVTVLHRQAGLPEPPRVPTLSHLAKKGKLSAVWFHPGSGGPTKCAPISLFLSLGRLLNRYFNLPCVVTASEQDSFLASEQEWHSLLALPGTRLFMNRPLLELCRDLGGAVLFIGNDSGIAHLAAGLGVKSLLFFCVTDPRRWVPWAPLNQISIIDCRHSAPPIEYVWQKLCALLDAGSTNGETGDTGD